MLTNSPSTGVEEAEIKVYQDRVDLYRQQRPLRY